MIIIFGRVPPPLGGVSVFCMRRIEQLRDSGSDYKHIDSSSPKNLLYLVLYVFYVKNFKKVDVEIEFNVSNFFAIIFLCFSGVLSYINFIDHNGSRHFIDSSLKKIFFYFFVKRVKKITVVNSKLKANYPQRIHYKIFVDSPFIAPSKKEIERSINNFPKQFKYLTELSERKIILVSAWKPVLTNSGDDLYGLSISLELYRRLLEKDLNYLFVVMIGEFEADEFSEFIRKKISKLEANFSNFVCVYGGFSQIALLNNTLALVRLTVTDGDSVSIREALNFGVKVIASDVTSRPDGCILVARDDVEQVENHILSVM